MTDRRIAPADTLSASTITGSSRTSRRSMRSAVSAAMRAAASSRRNSARPPERRRPSDAPVTGRNIRMAAQGRGLFDGGLIVHPAAAEHGQRGHKPPGSDFARDGGVLKQLPAAVLQAEPQQDACKDRAGQRHACKAAEPAAGGHRPPRERRK